MAKPNRTHPIAVLGINRTDGSHEAQLTVVGMGQTKSREDIEHLTVGELAKIANAAQALADELSGCLDDIAGAIATNQR